MQILGTNLLIMAFGYRSFAVGTAYSKTEAVQSAILALIAVAARCSPALAWVGIALGLSGVMTLSLVGTRHETRRPGARDGAAGGALRDLAPGSFRADHRVHQGSPTRRCAGRACSLRALFDLIVTNTLQTLMQGGFLAGASRTNCAGHHHLAHFSA